MQSHLDHPLNAKADPAVAADIARVTGVTAEVAHEAARIIGVWGSLETARRSFGALRDPKAPDYAILKYARLLDADAQRAHEADIAHQLQAISQHKVVA